VGGNKFSGGITMQDAFSIRHPLINFSYFVIVILFSMFLMDPACSGDFPASAHLAIHCI
jgi:hypothetical protein